MKLYAAVLLAAALLGGCDVSKRCVSIWVLYRRENPKALALLLICQMHLRDSKQ